MTLIHVLCMTSLLVTVVICMDSTAKRNETNMDTNALLTKLLNLHQYPCGETATCGSSKHVEPSEFVIPVPCCIPCSCLPSCVEQQNCCPWSVNGTHTVPAIELAGPKSIVHEIGTNTNNNRIVPQEHDHITSTTNDYKRTTKNIQELDESRSETKTRGITASSEVLNSNAVDMPNTKCIRPQVLYEPNKFLDSPAYMMVVNCPDEFKDKLTNDKCTVGMHAAELLDMIPVTSKQSGLTYINKYCLACNEQIQEDQIIEWRAEIVSYGVSRERIFFPSPDFIVDILTETQFNNRNVHFVPGDGNLTRSCNTVFDIVSCNQTGLWEVYDQSMETLCLDGFQLPVIDRIDVHRLIFKNIACLHCNTRRDLNEEKLNCVYFTRDRELARLTRLFSVTLNLKSSSSSDSNRSLVLAPYIENEALKHLPYRRCPAGKTYLMGRCREIICPRDHYTVENQCVPLYDTLKGLDINIRIQITPSIAIPDGISKDFVDGLKNVTDKALSDAVELQRRQFSVWKLPLSGENPEPYYLLDIFLFSPSNVLKFSDVIVQTKQFLLVLQEEIKRTVPLPPNIKLVCQFKHGLERKRNAYIDVMTGKTLKPLMEKGWSLIEPGPYMIISDVNWCYRAAFGFDEIEDYLKFIRVKAMDIIAFVDQYDLYKDNIYICIDRFIAKKHAEEEFDITQEVKTTADKNSGVSEEVVIDSERVLILTVSVIVVIILLVIRYRVKHAKAEKRSEESVESNNAPGDIELNVIHNLNTTDNLSLNATEYENNRNKLFAQGTKTSSDNKVTEK